VAVIGLFTQQRTQGRQGRRPFAVYLPLTDRVRCYAEETTADTPTRCHGLCAAHRRDPRVFS